MFAVMVFEQDQQGIRSLLTEESFAEKNKAKAQFDRLLSIHPISKIFDVYLYEIIEQGIIAPKE